jgi:hypothetical protein
MSQRILEGLEDILRETEGAHGAALWWETVEGQVCSPAEKTAALDNLRSGRVCWLQSRHFAQIGMDALKAGDADLAWGALSEARRHRTAALAMRPRKVNLNTRAGLPGRPRMPKPESSVSRNRRVNRALAESVEALDPRLSVKARLDLAVKALDREMQVELRGLLEPALRRRWRDGKALLAGKL